MSKHDFDGPVKSDEESFDGLEKGDLVNLLHFIFIPKTTLCAANMMSISLCIFYVQVLNYIEG